MIYLETGLDAHKRDLSVFVTLAILLSLSSSRSGTLSGSSNELPLGLEQAALGGTALLGAGLQTHGTDSRGRLL